MLDFWEEIIFSEIEKLCEICGHQSKMVVLWPIHAAVSLPGATTFKNEHTFLGLYNLQP